jgi:hypothetical protein
MHAVASEICIACGSLRVAQSSFKIPAVALRESAAKGCPSCALLLEGVRMSIPGRSFRGDAGETPLHSVSDPSSLEISTLGWYTSSTTRG